MHKFLSFLLLICMPGLLSARVVKDTLLTGRGDKVILSYDLSENNDSRTIRIIGSPRIIPGEFLKKESKGDMQRLKVVVFDRIGDFGKVKWKGLSPSAFTVPAGVDYDKSSDGYYILGESEPLYFRLTDSKSHEVKLPVYVAVYEKKQNYKLVESTRQPLILDVSPMQNVKSGQTGSDGRLQRIEINSLEELEGDNEDIIKALSSVRLVKEMLRGENEYPFSQTLQMEIYNLRGLKDKITDASTLDLINEALLLCNEKEQSLKEAAQNEKERQESLIEQQRQEELKRQQEAEEQARIEGEKQEKKTFWIVIGAAILAVLAFIGNAISKHFREVKNKKSILEMQESLARQAEHEAARRSKEVIRNKAHQAANKGKTKIREEIKTRKSSDKKSSKIREI